MYSKASQQTLHYFNETVGQIDTLLSHEITPREYMIRFKNKEKDLLHKFPWYERTIISESSNCEETLWEKTQPIPNIALGITNNIQNITKKTEQLKESDYNYNGFKKDLSHFGFSEKLHRALYDFYNCPLPPSIHHLFNTLPIAHILIISKRKKFYLYDEDTTVW